MQKRFVITVDGPVGVGKNTVCEIVAEKLNCAYLNSGSLFRAVAFIAEQQKYTPAHETVHEFLEDFPVQFKIVDQKLQITYQHEILFDELYTANISKKSSEVSRTPEIRMFVHSTLRELAKETSLIIDGRDAGSHIFPLADYKFYIDAKPEIRAHRRYLQSIANGEKISEAEVLKQIMERDFNDENKGEYSLRIYPGQIVIDTGTISAYDVAMQIISYIPKSYYI